ncbi:MAG: mismatch-specific DNA-glycosylase [Gemmatimonadaceae bacterium]|jgi:TDG/mug DNA glycosylase family protein|nr:mismatch-specific DNA-glycosylase [Gemmatimonadaceae bacterium]
MTILPDLLQRDLDLVICGTGAGRQSAERGAYYAGDGNRFWQTLAEVGLTPAQLEPSRARELLALGIGLTDLVKEAAGSDAELSFSIVDVMRLRLTIMSHRPWYVCFNGKRAAKEFLRVREVEYGVHGRLGRTTLFVAPSTSGLARATWDIRPWQELARRVRRPRHTNRDRYRSV